VDLQLDQKFETHEGAQAFVERTLAQFTRGKWRRYHDPEWTTLLTGRSSMLDESGRIAKQLTTVDPEYKIGMQDWIAAMHHGIIWRWSGDGVLATLTVNNDGSESDKPNYYIALEFDVLDVMQKAGAARPSTRPTRKLPRRAIEFWKRTPSSAAMLSFRPADKSASEPARHVLALFHRSPATRLFSNASTWRLRRQ
jgi:hypothetical protein